MGFGVRLAAPTIHLGGGKPTALTTDEAVSPFDAYRDSFYLLQRECVDSVLGGGAVTQTADEHVGSLGATFAAYESVQTGGIVEIR